MTLLDKVVEQRQKIYNNLFGEHDGGIYALTTDIIKKCGHKNIDPLWLSWGVFKYPPNIKRQTWLYVSSGMSNPGENDNSEEYSGMGSEFIFETQNDEEWAIQLVQELMLWNISVSIDIFPGPQFERLAQIPMPISPNIWYLILGFPTYHPKVIELVSGKAELHQVVGITQLEYAYSHKKCSSIKEGSAIICDLLVEEGIYPINDRFRQGVIKKIKVELGSKEKPDTNIRPVMIVSFALDNTLFDSSHFIRDLTFDVLTSDKYWSTIQTTFGKITKEGFGLIMQRDFLAGPSAFHDFSSLASGWAEKTGVDAEEFYKTLLGQSNAIVQDVDKVGVILGSPSFFTDLRDIRERLEVKGIDVIYLIITNKEKSIVGTQVANLMAMGKMPGDAFDAIIAWDEKGTREIYEASKQRKPETGMIFNALNRRVTESENKVPFIDPAKQRVGFLHIGDSIESDVMLSINMKKQFKDDVLVSAILMNTVISYQERASGRLLALAKTCKSIGVNLQMTSTQKKIIPGESDTVGKKLDDLLRDEYGVNVASSPSNFSLCDESSDHPKGDINEQRRIVNRIYEFGHEVGGYNFEGESV